MTTPPIQRSVRDGVADRHFDARHFLERKFATHAGRLNNHGGRIKLHQFDANVAIGAGFSEIDDRPFFVSRSRLILRPSDSGNEGETSTKGGESFHMRSTPRGWRRQIICVVTKVWKKGERI